MHGYCATTAFAFEIIVYTVTKIPICIPRKGIARPPSQIPHSCVCERSIYSQDRSTYFPAAEQADRSWEFVNCSQTHECGNWD
jgi:hypothetical protein